MIVVDHEMCKGCGDCVEVCPVDAIHLQNNTISIDQELCTDCQACVDSCPQGALSFTEMELEPEVVQINERRFKMPGGDRKGPRGEGPQTGRGEGYCEGNDQPGYAVHRLAQRLGLGFRWGGRGRGRGRRANTGYRQGPGRGRFSSQPVSKDQEAGFLKAQAEELQKTLQDIQSRIDKLDAE